MKRLVSICLLCAAAASAHAGNSELSTASENVGMASGIVLLGSMSLLAASGYVFVEGVEAVADGSVVVLKGAANAGAASIKLTGEAARGLSLAAGTVVSVVAVSTGHALVLSGKIIAYVPNEIGKSLLHHSTVPAAGI
ncbi:MULTISPECIES: hypothetical protein [unclassified Janthinobacterium]|uniref:hypothetical protein n=1 Tax=unclassified Janthinobacterium TaxID=2610881 RepID=UPI00038133C6|nr:MULTISPECIES: hypothetical protein [unclassified Janthinobacterium]MEC5159577.1 phage-related tail protein [Janthinobacterium sp. CG_S6]